MATYLAIGHLSVDRIRLESDVEAAVDSPSREALGGSIVFSGAEALALGWQLRIVTSTTDEWESRLRSRLPDADTCDIPSPVPTTFAYEWSPKGRIQRLMGVASRISAANVPDAFRLSDIWHLAPVMDEIDPRIVSAVPEGAFLGITPQGWMRTVGSARADTTLATSPSANAESAQKPDGDKAAGQGPGQRSDERSPSRDDEQRVRPKDWSPDRDLLRRTQAIVFSQEDIDDPQEHAAEWSRSGPIVVVTLAAGGADVYENGVTKHVPAIPIQAASELGAGDTFAAAFFIRLFNHYSALESAGFAAERASKALTGAP